MGIAAMYLLLALGLVTWAGSMALGKCSCSSWMGFEPTSALLLHQSSTSGAQFDSSPTDPPAQNLAFFRRRGPFSPWFIGVLAVFGRFEGYTFLNYAGDLYTGEAPPGRGLAAVQLLEPSWALRALGFVAF